MSNQHNTFEFKTVAFDSPKARYMTIFTDIVPGNEKVPSNNIWCFPSKHDLRKALKYFWATSEEKDTCDIEAFIKTLTIYNLRSVMDLHPQVSVSFDV